MDHFPLYEAAVQCVDADLDFAQRVYTRRYGHGFRLLREDFCGTAALAAAWVARGPKNRAWGVDLDEKTMDWGRAHHVRPLGPAARRLSLCRGDVRAVRTPGVDIICALNFSYMVFHRREALRDYFRAAFRGLRHQGLLLLDCFGGTEAGACVIEKKRVKAAQGRPAFTYIWEQASYNPVDHRTRFHIHFAFRGGRRLERAYVYDWRLWTLPELDEVLREAGFREAACFVEGWDESHSTGDGKFVRKTRFENQAGWVAYVVGYKR